MGFRNSFRLLAVTATIALSLLPYGNTQVIPSAGLAAEVLGAAISPSGTTFYGTPRTFSATVINIGTGSNTLDGNITFLAGGVPICTAPLIANNSLVGTQVSLSSLSLTLVSGLLNQLLPGLPSITQTIINAAITAAGGLTQDIVDTLLAPAVGPVNINAAAFAVCTTSTIPVGTYTQLSVAYAGLSVGGVSTGVPALLPALLGPLVNLGDFQVVKATDSVTAANPAPALPGAQTTLTATVANLNAPPSVLPPDGGTVAAFLGATQIGSGALTSFTGTSGTATFPITVPNGTPAGPQTITLQYSGTSNFAPATSGQNGSPAGPTLTVPYVVTLNGTPTPSPAPAGTSVSVAGTATNTGGPAPVGTVTLTVNGVTTAPFTLTQGANGVSTFTGTLTAPTNPANSPYPVTINYTPGSPAFVAPTPAPTFNLPVVPGTGSVTATASPASPAAGTPVTVTGKVTGSNALPPTGTINIQANGTTVGTATVNPDGSFSGSFVPIAPGSITVTAVYVPSSTSPVGAATSPPTTVTVVPSTATLTTAVAPNPSAPNSTVIASGTVTTTGGGSPGGGTVTVTINGQPVGSGPVDSTGKFSIPFTAPGTAGTYTVVTSFTPSGGSSPTGGGSAQLTVSTTGTDSITTTINPNPGSPGGSESATGTVTTATGSPGGTVTVTINGQTVGSSLVGSDGKFNVPFTAPTTPGTYTVITSYTPTGASAPTAVVATTFTVGSSGTGTTNITIGFGNGGTGGFAFPNCVGPLVVSVSGSGSPAPTGAVTLQISGGKLGNNAVAIGTASFANGVAIFNLESLKVKTELLNKFITHLGEFKTDLKKENILDYSLLPAGDFLLLPGEYTLTALYPGDATYAAASASAPFNIDPLCLLVALTLKA